MVIMALTPLARSPDLCEWHTLFIIHCLSLKLTKIKLTIVNFCQIDI